MASYSANGRHPQSETATDEETPRAATDADSFDRRGLSDNQLQAIVTRAHEAGYLRPTDPWAVTPELYSFITPVLAQCDDVASGDSDRETINSNDQATFMISSAASHHLNDYLRNDVCPTLSPAAS